MNGNLTRARLYFIMRVSVIHLFLLAAASLQLLYASPVNGQTIDDTYLNVPHAHMSLRGVLLQIESETDFMIVAPSALVGHQTDLNVPTGTVSVRQLLDLIAENTALNYRLNNKNVILFRKAEEISIEAVAVRVAGRITDVQGQGLPGVNVVVQGTSIGTSTDSDGRYSLEIPDGDQVLVFSFIGFKTISAQVGGRTIIDVTLENDVAVLEEVTISGGYYETTDRLKTGSIVKVSSKDIEKQPVTSPLMALQGRVAGLEITPMSGTPGVAPKIRIRGTNSLRNQSYDNNGNDPLYVIDGVPVNPTPINSWVSALSLSNGGYDPLSTINPANIESIEILKDGDATAIYGSRGANGVILITTKKNKDARKMTMDFQVYTGVGKVSRKLDVLDTKGYLSMRREALRNDGKEPGDFDFDLLFWDTTRSTNWQHVLIGGSARITDIQAGISFGARNTAIRFSGGYHKEALVFPGDFGYKRGSAQIAINHTSENHKLRLSISTNYGLENNSLFNDLGGVMTAALTLAPNAPRLLGADGSLNWEIYEDGEYKINSWINPLSYMRNFQKTQTTNLVTNSTVSYNLLENLVLSTNFGYTDLVSSEKLGYPRSAQSPMSTTASGGANFNDSKRSSWIIEPNISYWKEVNFHRFKMLLGATLQKSTNAVTYIRGTKYASDALLGSLEGAGLISAYRDDLAVYKYASTYTRLEYHLRERYLLSLTGRRDGSSRFGPGNRFGNFGAIGVAWIFSDEKFFKRILPVVSYGKIRGSYGITGNDQIGDYKYYNLYSVSSSRYGGLAGFYPYSLLNPDFAWEVTKKLEGTVELKLFENKVGLEVTWYRNRSSNQLVDYPLPTSTGFPSVTSNFDATIENSGFETAVNGDVLNSSSWRWNISFNISLPRNKLIKFDGIEFSPYANIYKVGEPLSVQWVHTYEGLDSETGLYKFTDRSGDGIINDADRIVKNVIGRRFYGGINNSIQYGQFELSFLLQFSRNKLSRFLPAMPGTVGQNQPVEVLERWRNAGDDSNVQRFSAAPDVYVNFATLAQSDYSMTDASFLRLKTLSLGYRFPLSWTEVLHLQDSRIFLQGQNLFTVTKYTGLDPETGASLPSLRMVTLGAQLSF